ncbi:MAG: SDR family NAD(P)-dependent oxidoreductase [Verrucomicrobia bacterium]|nr:SDR family NAD(P)-dependent oxidoreductase [Verrucomicrobiota bacterium]NBU08765.1 SDR family NAD(P)-dependent oxidoreductase [Pseudomonadota bacterium]NDA65744.1 SDR family NAD(P)-dependent oxidoreductase [Verrucomicrobiota bacterium]NDB74480.1 SDR family NAD(P)-dependent oxidoreductase [Verrucomicrobiota bacterium]NDD38154.1 SDR family NAD(P)-dependent oxidoreductase [Verrucomicrobiota bacterium]
MSEPAASLRVALVTGASGGLGRAFVAELLAQGWRVAAGFHRENVHPEAEQLYPLRLDVTARENVADAVAAILTRWQRIDLLINNAGLLADNWSWHLGDDDWQRVLDVHLKGAFLCAQAVLRPMLKQRDGHILNIASFSARTGNTGQANYAAAKAGLLGLTTSLAKEVGSRNVRVNALLPGVLPTQMIAGLTPQQLAAFAAANALGRLNDLAEVARFAAFLATTQNISGQLFQLDSRIARWS